MRGSPRRRGHFPPAVRDHPADEPARALVVTRVAPEGAKKEPDVLAKGIELVPERLARAEQVTADIAVDLEHEGGLRFLVRVIAGQEIREQLVVLENRIDRFAEESGLATETADRAAIGRSVAADDKCLFGVHVFGRG